MPISYTNSGANCSPAIFRDNCGVAKEIAAKLRMVCCAEPRLQPRSRSAAEEIESDAENVERWKFGREDLAEARKRVLTEKLAI